MWETPFDDWLLALDPACAVWLIVGAIGWLVLGGILGEWLAFHQGNRNPDMADHLMGMAAVLVAPVVLALVLCVGALAALVFLLVCSVSPRFRKLLAVYWQLCTEKLKLCLMKLDLRTRELEGEVLQVKVEQGIAYQQGFAPLDQITPEQLERIQSLSMQLGVDQEIAGFPRERCGAERYIAHLEGMLRRPGISNTGL